MRQHGWRSCGLLRGRWVGSRHDRSCAGKQGKTKSATKREGNVALVARSIVLITAFVLTMASSSPAVAQRRQPTIELDRLIRIYMDPSGSKDSPAWETGRAPGTPIA